MLIALWRELVENKNGVSDMTRDVIRLQNKLHEALDAFLSGSILRSSKFVPGWRLDELHPYWAQRFDEIAAITADIATTAAPRSRRGAYRSGASILSMGYRVLSRRVDQSIGEQERTTITPAQQLAAAGDGVLKQPILEELRRHWIARCGSQIQALFVHGSYSTQDTNCYSDLDALVIVKKRVVEDEDELYRFGRAAMDSYRCLLAADLLQHHGHFVLTEADLEYYCDAYFPRVLFDFATPLYMAGPISIGHVRDSSAESFAHLSKMCTRYTRGWDRRQLRLAYYLKLQLSSFMIIPALLMQTLGRPCYKRDSFAMAKPLFAPDVWQVMDEVSEMRHAWRQTRASVWKRMAHAYPFLWSQIVSRIGRWGVPDLIWETVKQPDFQERMAIFSRQCLSIVSESVDRQRVEGLD